MKITRIEPFLLRLPVVTEACDGTQDDLLMRIETDEGIRAWGEVDTSPDVSSICGLTEARKVAVIAQDAHVRGVLRAFKTGILLAATW